MQFMLKYVDIVFVAGLLALWTTGTAAASDTSVAVQIRGSTTLLPIVQRVGEVYMSERPEVRIVISGGGTARGYKAILDGTADIAMASGVVPDDIANENERKGIKLHSTTVSYDTIVAVVHPSNAINNLSLKQLKNIFTGRIDNWKDVGGKNAAIEVFVGPPSGGITDTWKRLILGEDDTYTPSGIVMSNAQRSEQVAAHPRAITFLTVATLSHPNLKILKVNGIAADADTVRDGRYPLRAPLMLVTTDKPSEAAKDFIKYFSAPQKAALSDGTADSKRGEE